MTATQIKRLRGYSEHSRYLSDVEYTDREIPRIASIPSPYVYSQTHCVMVKDGMDIIIVETKHRQYDVFKVGA